jgi:hypothetical protein
MKKQKYIKKLIPLVRESIFMSEEVKARLLAKLERMEHTDLDELKEVLTAAKYKQDGLFEKIVAHDDTFLSRLKQWKRAEIRKEFHRYEKQQKGRAEEILTDIDT